MYEDEVWGDYNQGEPERDADHKTIAKGNHHKIFESVLDGNSMYGKAQSYSQGTTLRDLLSYG